MCNMYVMTEIKTIEGGQNRCLLTRGDQIKKKCRVLLLVGLKSKKISTNENKS